MKNKQLPDAIPPHSYLLGKYFVFYSTVGSSFEGWLIDYDFSIDSYLVGDTPHAITMIINRQTIVAFACVNSGKKSINEPVKPEPTLN